MNRKKVVAALMGISALLFLTTLTTAKDEKMDPKELVALHLKSVGPAEKLSARKDCVAEGGGVMRILGGGSGTLTGPAMLVSEGDKVRLTINFGYLNYPSEQYVFDGQKFDAGDLSPGRRSRFGNFLYTYPAIVTEGLLGGVLTTAWPLENLEKRNPKLRYGGIKKIGGKDLHELRYVPRKGGGDLTILMYFEPDTYRHVETIYRVVIPAQIPMGGSSQSAVQRETRYEIEEKFENFQSVDGLTLPIHWDFRLTMEGLTTSITEWDLNFTKIAFDQPLDSKAFTLSQPSR